jgi:hypothetical protein
VNDFHRIQSAVVPSFALGQVFKYRVQGPGFRSVLNDAHLALVVDADMRKMMDVQVRLTVMGVKGFKKGLNGFNGFDFRPGLSLFFSVEDIDTSYIIL